MSAIKFSPYIPNVEAWVEFYKNQADEYKPFYTIGKPKQKGEEMDPIKLITPTESVIERAKSTLKRERETDDMLPARKRGTNTTKGNKSGRKPSKKAKKIIKSSLKR